MDAVVAANNGIEPSYAGDTWSLALQEKFSELFEKEVLVFPVVTGTAANALALSAIAPAFGKIYCHELGHINTDECGAPELFTNGAKLICVPGDNAAISAEALEKTIYGSGNVHHAQPAAVSITQARETGTVYTLDDIAAIAKTAHDHKLHVHMDGARFANALVALGATPAEMTWKSGVDVLSFGGTKNGCLAAEAVVFFKHDLAKDFPYLHKRAGQLLSKMRFISAQLLAYVADDVWLRNARHANTMAALLSQGLTARTGIQTAYPTQSNEVFACLPPALADALRSEGIDVNEDELDGSAARFVTAWNTAPGDVDQFLEVVASATSASG